MDALAKTASPTTSAAIANVVVPARSLVSSPAVFDDEKDWTMGTRLRLAQRASRTSTSLLQFSRVVSCLETESVEECSHGGGSNREVG